jgi:hypothetical protein
MSQQAEKKDAFMNHTPEPLSRSVPSTLNDQPPVPQGRRSTSHALYRLVKGHGFWQLTFAGQDAVLKHEQGLAYVAYLLLNPPAEPIHALDLATRIAAIHGKKIGIAEIEDPETGKKVLLENHSRLQERSLALDAAQAMRAVLRTQNELEALVEDEDQIGPVKAEAYRQLIALYDFETKNSQKVRDSAAKAADAVGRAILRFHQRLGKAIDPQGHPHSLLRSFADHLEQHLLLPSGRGRNLMASRTCKGLGGRFTYQPPAEVVWEA